MCKIEKVALENAKKIYIDKCQWGYDKYKPEIYFQIVYDEKGFKVLFTVGEKNPKRDMKNHFDPVNLDSCVEIFLNFDPKTSKRYMNFEVNANGAMNVAFRADRHDKVVLKKEEVEGFFIKAEVFDDYWTVGYTISYDFIKSYYPEFDINKCEYLLGNAYKCGDETEIEHYIALFDVGTPTPDYHRIEYFQKFELVK